MMQTFTIGTYYKDGQKFTPLLEFEKEKNMTDFFKQKFEATKETAQAQTTLQQDKPRLKAKMRLGKSGHSLTSGWLSGWYLVTV